MRAAYSASTRASMGSRLLRSNSACAKFFTARGLATMTSKRVSACRNSQNQLTQRRVSIVYSVNRAAGSASYTWASAARLAAFCRHSLVTFCEDKAGDRAMEGRDVRRPDDQPATKAEGTAAVKSPSDFGSSPAPDAFPSGSSPTLFELASDAPTIAEGTSAGSAGTSHPPDLNNPTLLRPGTVLGRRYEILQLLGQGG